MCAESANSEHTLTVADYEYGADQSFISGVISGLGLGVTIMVIAFGEFHYLLFTSPMSVGGWLIWRTLDRRYP